MMLVPDALAFSPPMLFIRPLADIFVESASLTIDLYELEATPRAMASAWLPRTAPIMAATVPLPTALLSHLRHEYVQLSFPH
jgi:hypothetical protein